LEIIAVYNIKGGVGKTTTAVNLAYLSAAAGWPTLLWDLDPQGAAGYMLKSHPRKRSGAGRLIRGKRELDELVRPTDYERLDIVPSHFSYRRMDLHLSERKKPAATLMKLMRSLQGRYASLFLDCPPGLSLVSENILHAADAILVPVLPSPLSARMLGQLTEFVDKQNWHDLVLMPFFSMVDRRRALHRKGIEGMRERFPIMLQTEVPYLSAIEQASVRQAPLPSYAGKSVAASIYSQLWQEFDSRMDVAFGRGSRSVTGCSAADGGDPSLDQ
jgi:chromosome partitioning protein